MFGDPGTGGCGGMGGDGGGTGDGGGGDGVGGGPGEGEGGGWGPAVQPGVAGGHPDVMASPLLMVPTGDPIFM